MFQFSIFQFSTFQLPASQIQEHHTEENEGKVHYLVAQVLLVEDESSHEERDEDAATTNHGDHRYQRLGQGQGVEIDEVGSTEEEGDEQNGPFPTDPPPTPPVREGSRLRSALLRPPQDWQHHHKLIEHEEALYDHVVDASSTCLHRCQQVLVEEGADGSKRGCEYCEDDPAVVAKIDALFLAAAAEEVEAEDGTEHTHPLIEIQAFAKDEDGPQQHHYRTGGIDGANDGQGQVLQGEIAAEPRGEDDDGLEDNILMYVPTANGDVEEGVGGQLSPRGEQDERQEDERPEEGVER